MVDRMSAADAGMLIRKIQRHPKKLVIAPPTMGPAVRATPKDAPQNANARERAAPENVWEMIANDAVSRRAPPIPCTALAMFSRTVDPASPQAPEAAANMN